VVFPPTTSKTVVFPLNSCADSYPVTARKRFLDEEACHKLFLIRIIIRKSLIQIESKVLRITYYPTTVGFPLNYFTRRNRLTPRTGIALTLLQLCWSCSWMARPTFPRKHVKFFPLLRTKNSLSDFVTPLDTTTCALISALHQINCGHSTLTQ